MENFDLEEVESVLYGQVFHGYADRISESERNENSTVTNVTIATDSQGTTCSIGKRPRYNRYYEDSPSKDDGTTNQISETSKTTSHSDVRSENNSSPIVNRITINQYTYSPLVVKQPRRKSRPRSKRKAALAAEETIKIIQQKLTPSQRQQATGFQKEVKKIKNQLAKTQLKQRKAEKQVKKIQQQKNKKNQEKQSRIDDVICLSDSNDDDCVEVVPEPDHPADESDNDEIIYIEPPPVPVVNVDPDSSEEDNQNEKNDNPPAEENDNPVAEENEVEREFHVNLEPICSLDTSASNDFLDEESLDTLQRPNSYETDFANVGFVKPHNPTEVYQTSESSTSEQREFVNSVKTIVFNEVEFPGNDLFSDTNLESFGSFITPKKTVQESTPKKSITKKTKKKEQVRSCSSDSSSESDYDAASNRGKTKSNLPTLSPMHPPNEAQTDLSKNKKNKNKISETTNKNKEEKRKNDICSEKEVDRNEGGSTEGDTNNTISEKPSKAPKRKRKSKDSQNIEEPETNSLESNGSSDEDYRSSEKPSKIKDKRKNEIAFEKEVADNINSEKPSKTTKKKGKSKDCANDSQNIEESQTNSLKSNNSSISNEKISISKRKRSKTRSTDESTESKDDNATSTNKKRQQLSTEQESSNIINDLDIPTDLPKNNIENNTETNKQSNQSTSIKDNVTVTESINLQSVEEVPSTSFNTTAQSEQELIVVDEVDSDTNVEILNDSSSWSEDFMTLDDVGHDLELANTSLSRIIVTDKDGLARDYSEFDLDSIQEKMSDDPNCWKICAQDRAQLYSVRPKGPRCQKCRNWGHQTFRCPNKPEIPSCKMCGTQGHEEPRCPNRVCFQCGNNGSYSTTFCWKCADYRRNICTVCNTLGHNIHVCPDLWRRYHLTTSPGPINTQDGPQLKSRDEQWCAGCAQQGHLDFECNSYLYTREYPSVPPVISEYKDVYHISEQYESVGNSSPKINPFSINRNIPNPQIQGNNFVQVNRSIFDSPSANTSTTEKPSELFRQQVINPFSIFNNNPNFGQPSCSNSRSVELSYDDLPMNRKETSKETHRRYNRLFSTAPIGFLQRFISREIQKLNSRRLFNIAELKRKYFMASQSKYSYQNSVGTMKALHKTTELYKQLNMCIFGVHFFENGKKHLDYLKNFVVVHPRSGLSMAKRETIRIAHEYIFGGLRHEGYNYDRALTTLAMLNK